MVDRYDDELGFTAMARTTAFTGAVVARMIARGDLKARGMRTPEQLIIGPLFERLVVELAAANVHFEVTSECIVKLG
jgi:saccharopine dehydrogenase-like NADP-dependent oxidoreductase